VHLPPLAKASALVIELDDTEVIARLSEYASLFLMLNVSDDPDKAIGSDRRQLPFL
jgi:hypothetical protein